MPDNNSKCKQYLLTEYVVDYPSGHSDLTTLMTRKIKSLTGEATARVKAILAAAA